MVVIALVVGACGANPLSSVGKRSSDWINEPEIVTTTAIPTIVLDVVGSQGLAWSNDEIVNPFLEDIDVLVATVFARRQGDRFIQASRAEIAAALPDVSFPAFVPYGAEWVSSQLIIENSGRLSDEPSAAFGIWSVEPYTRSRSVAQMAVLQVALDRETSAELELPDAEVSCARFADRATNQCVIVTVGDRDLWRLTSNSGTTIVWFDSPYRYELYGRTFVSPLVLEQVAARSVPLSDLVDANS